MSLGHNFIEALGKVMRSLETSRAGFWTKPDTDGTAEDALERLRTPTEGRLYDVELALRLGASVTGWPKPPESTRGSSRRSPSS